MIYRFGWHLWDASTTRWRIIRSNLQLCGSPYLLGKSGWDETVFYSLDRQKNHLHVNFWHSDHMFYLGSFHKMLYCQFVCSWLQTWLIRNTFFEKLTSSGVSIFQYFYFMEDFILVEEQLHHISGQGSCSFTPCTDIWMSEIGAWSFSVFSQLLWLICVVSWCH